MSILTRPSMSPPEGTPTLGTRDDVVAARPRKRFHRKNDIVAVLDPSWAAPGAPTTESVHAPTHVMESAARELSEHLQPGEVVAAVPNGRLALRLRREDSVERPLRLQEMAYHCVETLTTGGHRMGLVDLGVGWASVSEKVDPERAGRLAAAAAHESGRQRDQQPRHHDGTRKGSKIKISWWSNWTHVMLATVAAVVLPFLALVGAYHLGIDLAAPLYWVLAASLGVTAVTIWGESLYALDPPKVPDAPDRPAPKASAVIAAYLPNEADTIFETLDAFAAQEYAGGLQVVLAYNTPTPMPVEAALHTYAAEHPELTVLKVEDSTSKAQNVNAALRIIDGEFVGIFDADHHPMPGAFQRAWQWIASGADVVQGHCVIRNGDDSLVAKLVAVEFEQIYAVSHPGRAAMHGFGIFGGSNGYWSADALKHTRLRGSFLTEDIEASMRLLANGGQIVNDPGLVSYELAPDTPGALWKQRMRWAQGWFQVSCRYLWPALKSPKLTLRQKFGTFYLLGWREIYPWISLMAVPLLGFMAWRDGGLSLDSPIFLLATLFVMASGPVQTAFAWRLAAPEVRRHKGWFVYGALASTLVYSEAKNIVNRVAHLKQLRGEHQWVVTPRTAPTTASSTEVDA